MLGFSGSLCRPFSVKVGFGIVGVAQTGASVAHDAQVNSFSISACCYATT